MEKRVVLTGLTPSAENLHIGNYIGSLRGLVKLQNDENNRMILFCSDLHALTNPTLTLNFAKVKESFVATYVAAGIDLEKTLLFYQSDVHTHAELGWVLTCNCYFGELTRMTQFKDKASRMKQGNGTDMIPAGLFVYPPLMCADILLYDADIVPVGKDQLQHIELTRNVAERFNKKYGQTFKLPDAYRPRKAVPNILDLADTNHKMSKSRPPKGAIFLNDTMEDIEKKIKTALTDNFNKVKFDPINQPAISNLITIYSELADVEVEEIEKKFENIENYGVFKKELTKVVQEFISNFQTKYKAAMENIDHYLGLVAKNAKKCLEITEPKLLDIYKKVGLK